MSYSVGQVAGFAGVTVRTLHHYDEIGLLAPGGRSHAGHRRYSDADLDRLQQILFYRELGFPLDEVAALLDDPEADPRAHLRRQHELLTARIEQAPEDGRGRRSTPWRHARWASTSRPRRGSRSSATTTPSSTPTRRSERWGGTDAYAESQRRAARYTKEDWKRIREANDDWMRALRSP